MKLNESQKKAETITPEQVVEPSECIDHIKLPCTVLHFTCRNLVHIY